MAKYMGKKLTFLGLLPLLPKRKITSCVEITCFRPYVSDLVLSINCFSKFHEIHYRSFKKDFMSYMSYVKNGRVTDTP